MTYADVFLVLAAVFALLLITGACRRSRRRTHRVNHLTDLSRGYIDPDWERTRSTMTIPNRRPRRIR